MQHPRILVAVMAVAVAAATVVHADNANADTDYPRVVGEPEIAPGYLKAVGHQSDEIASIGVTGIWGPQVNGLESELLATLHVWRWLHLTGGVAAANESSGAEATSAKPFLGALISIGDWRRDGQLTIGCIYKTEGFTESEGEIESSITGSRLLNANALLAAEARYGQDADGRERDVELAANARWMMGAWSVGLGGRGRTGKDKMSIVRSDLLVGPDIAFSMSPHQYLLAGIGWQAQDYASVTSNSGYIMLSYGATE